jgi:hypothetical protein
MLFGEENKNHPGRRRLFLSLTHRYSAKTLVFFPLVRTLKDLVNLLYNYRVNDPYN